jgi:hypothetical protein
VSWVAANEGIEGHRRERVLLGHETCLCTLVEEATTARVAALTAVCGEMGESNWERIEKVCLFLIRTYPASLFGSRRSVHPPLPREYTRRQRRYNTQKMTRHCAHHLSLSQPQTLVRPMILNTLRLNLDLRGVIQI